MFALVLTHWDPLWLAYLLMKPIFPVLIISLSLVYFFFYITNHLLSQYIIYLLCLLFIVCLFLLECNLHIVRDLYVFYSLAYGKSLEWSLKHSNHAMKICWIKMKWMRPEATTNNKNQFLWKYNCTWQHATFCIFCVLALPSGMWDRSWLPGQVLRVGQQKWRDCSLGSWWPF